MIVKINLEQGGQMIFTGNVLKIYSIGEKNDKKLAIETANTITSFKFTNIKTLEIEKAV